MPNKPPNALLDKEPCDKCGQPHVNALGNPTCRAHRNDGSPCGQYASVNQRVCGFHGGKQPAAIRNAQRREVERKAEAKLAKLRDVIEAPTRVDAAEALQQEVDRTNAIVAWLGNKVAQLDETAPVAPGAGSSTTNPTAVTGALGGHPLVWGTVSEADVQASEYPGVNTTDAAELNLWYVMWKKEREHLVIVTKAAIQAGVEQKRLEMSMEQGSRVASVIQAVMDDLLLTDAQRELMPGLVLKHLQRLLPEPPRVIEQVA